MWQKMKILKNLFYYNMLYYLKGGLNAFYKMLKDQSSEKEYRFLKNGGQEVCKGAKFYTLCWSAGKE